MLELNITLKRVPVADRGGNDLIREVRSLKQHDEHLELASAGRRGLSLNQLEEAGDQCSMILGEYRETWSRLI